MSLFHRRRRDTLCGVIVVIGSGSVTASIVLSRQQKELPEILYTHRELMSVRSTATLPSRVRAMRHALFSVMLELEHNGMAALYKRQGRVHIHRMLVSCTAPWSHVATQILRFRQDAPFTVTPRLIEEVIAHAYEKEEETRADTARALAEEDQHIVEKLIVDITLNGYSIPHPFDKEASEIAIAHLRGVVSTPILVALDDTKKHILDSVEVRIHTSSLILFCVLRDLYPEVKTALIIDVSGEATGIGLMQDGILYESVTAAYGMHSLVRDVASAGKTIPEEAQAYLRGYTQNVLTETEVRALLRAQKRYISSLKQAFGELAARYVLPRTVFLILDQDMEQFFSETIRSAIDNIGTRTPKTIITLSPDRTHDLVTTTGDEGASPRLAITARFFHKLHACGEMDN